MAISSISKELGRPVKIRKQNGNVCFVQYIKGGCIEYAVLILNDRGIMSGRYYTVANGKDMTQIYKRALNEYKVQVELRK